MNAVKRWHVQQQMCHSNDVSNLTGCSYGTLQQCIIEQSYMDWVLHLLTDKHRHRHILTSRKFLQYQRDGIKFLDCVVPQMKLGSTYLTWRLKNSLINRRYPGHRHKDSESLWDIRLRDVHLMMILQHAVLIWQTIKQ